MTEPIKVGDLVQVVRARSCCGNPCDLGYIYTVSGFFNGYKCYKCMAVVACPVVMINGEFSAKEMSRVKRIPPLSELEGQRTEEKLREPTARHEKV